MKHGNKTNTDMRFLLYKLMGKPSQIILIKGGILMNARDLKKYIYENEMVEHVLESIDCHSIQYHHHYKKPYYSCANYNGDNPNAINVTDNEFLNVRNWTRPDEFPFPSDIIKLVQYNKKLKLRDAIEYLHSILGLEYSYSKKDAAKMKNKDEEDAEIITYKETVVHTLKASCLDLYEPIVHIDWFRDGVMEYARKKFDIRYSYQENCVVIPHRHWKTGELLGINKRTMYRDWEARGFSKYRISSGYNKSNNIYGLWENREDIEKAGYVVVVESEKSVLKRYSLLDHTVVALSGKFMSEEQKRILLELDVQEIVIALDKDVSLTHVREMCEGLWKDRKVSYIYDDFGILGEKDSPADARKTDYEFLFIMRVEYDEAEHQRFLKGA